METCRNSYLLHRLFQGSAIADFGASGGWWEGEFSDDTVNDLEVSIGELSIDGTCDTGGLTCHFPAHLA